MDRSDSELKRLEETERRFVEATIASTADMLKDLDAMRELGTEINGELELQNAKIVRANGTLKSISNNLFVSDVILGKIRSPLGFTGKAQKYCHTFESKHGKPADWSGPLYIKRKISRGYKENFFAVLGDRLFRYRDSAHIAVEQAVITLRDTTILTNEGKLKFKLRLNTTKPKTYSFKCSTKNEFIGWVGILSNRSKADENTSKEKESDNKESFYNAVPQETPRNMSRNISFAERNSHDLFRNDDTFLRSELLQDDGKKMALDENLDKIDHGLDMLHQLVKIQSERVISQNSELGNLNNAAESTLSRFGKTNTDLKRRI